MKAVSKAYKESMRSMLRGQSHVRVTFGNIDSTAASDGEWESNGQLSYSTLDTLDYDFEYQDTYATLELNRWALDGKTLTVPASGTVHDGFIGSFLTNGNGEVTTASVLTREFSDPAKHTFPGITLTFDTRSKEHPISVNIKLYQNGEEVETVDAAIDGTKAVIETMATNVDKVIVTIGGGLPYRRARIQDVVYGVEKTFENGDLVSITQKHDVDPLSRRLPVETMQFVILDYEHKYDPDNSTGVYQYVDKNSPVRIQYGYTLPDNSIEWLQADNYVMDAKPTIANNQATFTCTGMIGDLTGTYYKGAIGNKSFYDMAENVLLDANLSPTATGENPWDIDDSLKQMYTTAALPIATHMNCLQLIAHACRCRLYTDDANIIHIKPFGVTVLGIYSGEWSDNGTLPYSDFESVDTGSHADNTYVTLELNRWTLDGESQIILDDFPTKHGYIGSEQAMSDGLYLTAPVIAKDFDVSHDLPVVGIRFDTILNDYPTGVTLRYYNGQTLLDVQSETNITGSQVLISSRAARNCTRLEIEFLGGLPYHRPRVHKVFYRETDFTLDFSAISENSQTINKIDELKTVSVSKYAYTADGEAQTLYEGTTAEEQLHVEFSGMATDIEISVTGGDVISAHTYARAADIVLSSGTKNVVITGKTLTENSVVVSYPVSPDGEIDKEENPLITNDEMCDALAAHVAKYLKMRNTYEASYRGNPEMETGDVIGLQTLYTDEMDALVLVDEITFNGSLSGKMVVKGLI